MNERLYDYPIAGTPPLRPGLARSVGADTVMVRVAGAMDDVLAARVGTLLDVLADVACGAGVSARPDMVGP